MIFIVILIYAFFLYLTVKLYRRQTWQGPDDDPCENCLRWGECHGVGIDSCPHCIDWRE